MKTNRIRLNTLLMRGYSTEEAADIMQRYNRRKLKRVKSAAKITICLILGSLMGLAFALSI